MTTGAATESGLPSSHPSDAESALDQGALRGSGTPVVVGRRPPAPEPDRAAPLFAGFAVIGDVQRLPGYVVLITDDPSADHLTELPSGRRPDPGWLTGADPAGRMASAKPVA